MPACMSTPAPRERRLFGQFRRGLRQPATITIPAGVYDWEVRMPDKGGNLMWYIKDLWHPARADDYEFQAGYTYDFHVVQDGFSYCLSLRSRRMWSLLTP